ncbi:MAG: heparinase II/III family protein [Clostridiales bacterium]|nr:heparinase II/III family protein [Clostridiales bacterium]
MTLFQDSRFFFRDPFAIAAHAQREFPKECERVIASADRAASGRFRFDLRWDMERTTDDVIFEDDIDWLRQPADDPEWVYAFNRMRFWITMGQAYALTRDEKYPKAFAKQLSGWIKTVRKDDPCASKGWRSIEVGLRLEYWLKAMAYFSKSPSINTEVVELFAGSVIDHCDFLMAIWNPYNMVSNWGVLGNHGLFMAGALMPSLPGSECFLKEALRRLDQEIRMQVYRDGTHWEQSPMYHNEVLSCYLDVCVLAQRNGIVLPEAIARKTRDMCHATLRFSKPDHNEIPMGDSDEIDVRDILSRGAVAFQDEALRSGCDGNLDFDALWELGEEGLDAWKALQPEYPADLDKPFMDSGNFFFRTSWKEDATFLHFHCGTLGAGHGHADKLHFNVSTRGEDILTDAGRFTYVFGEDRIRFKSMRSHNTIMVDGEETYVPKDSWEVDKLGRAVNQRFFSSAEYGYAEGGCLSYLIPSGVFLNRRLIFLKPDIILAADEMLGTGKHSYTHFFHFGNTGPVILTGSVCKYAGKKAEAQIMFLGKETHLKLVPSFLSRRYNEREENVALEASSESSGFSSTLTAIGLSSPGENVKLEVEQLAVASCFKGFDFADSQIEAYNIKFGDRFYTVALAHQEYASPTDSFNADGCVGFGNVVVFDRTKCEKEIGTVLAW